MSKIIATPTSGQINIGKQGENLARRVQFELPPDWDLSDPAASVQLVVRRAGEGTVYPVALMVEGGLYYWPVSAADTGRVGYGECELRYLLGDVVAKSMTWATYVVESVGEDMADPPSPGESYVNQVAAEGAKAVAAAEKATAAAVHPPKLSEQYTWMVWDFELGQYVDTGVSAGGSGDGTPGGYYTPVVTQPDANTMRVAYTPSQEGMPTVPQVDVVLPAGSGSESSVNAEPAVDDIPIVFLSGELPTAKTENTMGFRYISKSKDVSGFVGIKCQGNSSMSYPKKNFTVKMFADADLSEKRKIDFRGWGEQHKHVYKANWIDLTHARNVVSARLWADIVKSRPDYAQLPELLRDSPNQGAVDGFPIKVYANGVYQGRYTLNIPKDKWCYNMDDTLDTHCILCGENYVSGCFRAAANINGSDWTDELHDTVPASIKTRWNEIISFVQNSTDSEFLENLEEYFDVQSLIDYHLFGLASCGLDAYGKNQIYLTYDGTKWIASMYDMDSTWGLWWTGASFVATDYGRSEYQDFKDGEGNLLYIRLESLFYEKLQERWAELRNGALSIENILNRFERFIDVAPSELVKEDYASTTADGAFTGIPSKNANNLQQIRAFAVARRAWVDEYVDGLTPTEEVPCTGITLDKAELTFTETGSRTLIATLTPENTTDHVVWESGDVSVATVSDGIVVAVGNGSTTITATCGEYSANCAVSVSGISGGDASDEVDYTIDPLADVTWLENQKYSAETGVLQEYANEYCTTKFRLQGCVYNLTVSGGSYVGLYMWDESGTYVCRYETGANFGNFVANPNWQYAIKFYTVSAFDSSAATLMPVDNTSNVAQTTKLTLNMADFDWRDTSLCVETDITEKLTSAGFTSLDRINKTNGHHVFLCNATNAIVINNTPVFSLFQYKWKYVLAVMDSKADFVKTSGWTLVLN